MLSAIAFVFLFISPHIFALASIDRGTQAVLTSGAHTRPERVQGWIDPRLNGGRLLDVSQALNTNAYPYIYPSA